MRHWLQLATRNWRVRPARSGLAMLAIALGVGVVVWVTCCYESVRLSVTSLVEEWIGRSHVVIEPHEGRWALFSKDVESAVAKLPNVAHTTKTTREFVEVAILRNASKEPSSDQSRDRKGAVSAGPERLLPDGGDSDLASQAATKGRSTDSQPTMVTPYIPQIEAKGIEPHIEKTFRNYELAAGEFLTEKDDHAVVVEQLFAEICNVGLGDELLIRHILPPNSPEKFRIIGIVNRRRASMDQFLMVWLALTDVQRICKFPEQVKSVDVILRDHSVAAIQKAAEDIRALVERHNAARTAEGLPAESIKVSTTEGQHKRLGAAQSLLQFIMMLLSCVVLLTAFFIILATMNMGVVERIRELGLLRCVGMTRRQLCIQVLMESLPIGLAGVAVGVPLGLLLQWATIQLVQDYVGKPAISQWGMLLAVVGGIMTTLVGAAAPAMRAMSVSPVEATRPLAGTRRYIGAWLAALAGVALLVGHALIRRSMSTADPTAFNVLALSSLVALYGGFACLMPAVIVLVGRVAVQAAALLLALKPQLLGDEIDKSPFRASAIASGLAVGLSLIVGLVVWGESVKRGWEFPKEFPEAILYAWKPVPLDTAESLADIPGLKEFSAADDFPFSLTKPSLIPFFSGAKFTLDTASRFIAVNPDTAFDVVKVTYLEGNKRDAVAKLRRGRHILVTREFSEARKKHLGDVVTLWVGDKKARFKVAGVIASPGLDIAISFFNATDYFQYYAVGSIIGTLKDAHRLFGRDKATLLFFNFEPPKEVDKSQKSGFSDQEQDAASASASFANSSTPNPSTPNPPTLQPSQKHKTASPLSFGNTPIEGDTREVKIVNEMLQRLGNPVKAYVTASQLKRQISTGINNVTLLLSAIPFVGLIVAALGVANLMTANVASRSHQIAVLRAIGATRRQIARMVIGEALVLGLIGSVAGLLLGVYLGHASNGMTEMLTGYHPALAVPAGLVAAGAILATALCVFAALAPARRASKSNIVAALSQF